MLKPDFPTVVDNSILSAYRTCERLGYYQYLQHFKPKTESVHLIAGGAFAAGLEAMRNSFFIRCESLEDATYHGFIALTKHYGWHDFSYTKKGYYAVVLAYLYYLQEFNPETDNYKPFFHQGQPTVEYSFVFPLPILHPQTGEPILYSGRADSIVKDRNGIIFLEDDKTTSQLGPSFANKWDMRAQFTGYVYAAQKYGHIPVRGILIRGICFYADGSIKHQELTTYRNQDEIDNWYETTIETTKRLVNSWTEEKSLMDLGDACEAYGGCGFKGVCKSRNPEQWLKVDFTRKIWDPVNRQEIIL